jgi:D-xylose transport system substrate-binding protein
MKKALTAILALAALAACDQRAAVGEVARCNRELGETSAQLALAQSAQAAAERKAQALDEQLKAAQAELAAQQRKGGGAVAAAEPAPAPRADDAAAETAAAAVLAPPAPPIVPPRKGALRVGLSMPTTQEERWVKDKLVMIAEAKKRGVELLVQQSENDAAKQAMQCDQLIASGIKVLIIAPVDASGAAVIVDKAVKAGVQVISYDRLVTDSPHDYYYLSFDNVKVGELQGEYITRKVSRGNYLVLAGSPTDNNAKLFKEGAMKYLKPLVDKGHVKIVFDQFVPGWAPTEAQKMCESVLAAGTRVDAVLAPNDGTAGGCINALQAHGLAGKVPITGQDAELAAAQRIIQGTQSMTIFKDTRLLGKEAISMADALVRGKAIETNGRTVSNNKRPVRSVLLTPYLVTRENLDKVLIDSGYLNRAAVYRK